MASARDNINDGTLAYDPVTENNSRNTTEVLNQIDIPGVKVSSGRAAKESSNTKDMHWVRRSFLSFRKTPATIQRSRASTARQNYTDTTLGGDFAINTPYQYTRFADIKARQIVPIGKGKGRFYHEQIWDNRHDIQIQFGFQAFSNPLVFFSRWYSYSADRFARTGRMPSWLYGAMKLVGTYVMWTIPAYRYTFYLTKLFSAFGGQTRYAYLKPGMYAYWGVVNNMINTVAANMAVTQPIDAEAMQNKRKQMVDAKEGAASLRDRGMEEGSRKYARSLPTIYQSADYFGGDGGFYIDMLKISTRAQRLHNMFNEALQAKIENWVNSAGSAEQFRKYLSGTDAQLDDFIYDKAMEFSNSWTKVGQDAAWGLGSWMQAVTTSWFGTTDDPENGHSNDLNEKAEMAKDALAPADSIAKYWGRAADKGDVDNSLYAIARASLQNGAEWISFRVNATKSVSESFSNSAAESELANAFNSFAKAKQKFAFNVMGGGILGETGQKVVNMAMDAVMGGLSGLGLEGLAGLVMGTAMIDIPKTWESSSANLPRLSYELNLRTPYGHPLAIFQDLIIPTCCVLAGGLPISRGRAAHGHPFYCQVWDKGRWQVHLGMIGSINITRGVGNVPWSRHAQPLGIDVSFEILDMTNIISLPATGAMGVTDLIDKTVGGGIIDDLSAGNDTPMDDYLFALSSLGMVEQLYMTNRIGRNWNKVMRQFATSFSADAWINQIVNSAPVSVLQIFANGVER